MRRILLPVLALSVASTALAQPATPSVEPKKVCIDFREADRVPSQNDPFDEAIFSNRYGNVVVSISTLVFEPGGRRSISPNVGVTAHQVSGHNALWLTKPATALGIEVNFRGYVEEAHLNITRITI